MGNGRRLVFLIAVLLLTVVGAAAVQAQPNGIYVSPGDGQRDVSPGSYIRVNFQERMDVASVEAALTVSPTVAGAFNWDGDGRYLMYLPAEPLAPQTQFVATLGTGVRTLSGRQILSRPYQWRFDTRDDHAEASFSYRMPVQLVTPKGGLGVPIQTSYPRVTMDLTLYEVDLAAFAARYSKLQSGQRSEIDTEGLPLIASWQAYSDNTTSAARVKLPDGTEPGLYVLDARSPRVKAGQTFVIYSDYAIAATEGADNLSAWVTSVPDGAPAAGADVKLVDGSGATIVSAATDENGVARLNQSSLPFVVAEVGEQTTLVALDDAWFNNGYYRGWWGGSGWLPQPPEFAAHIHTDRPIYRPGHTVHYKASIRRFVGNEFEVIAPSTSITMTVKDVTGNTVSASNPTADEFGSVAGDLSLGEDASLGDWRIEVTVGAQTFTGYFAVQEYVKPDYEVVVETDEPFYVTGDTAEITVQADYYFGQPAAGAEVVLRVFRGYYYWYSRSGNQIGEYKGTTGPDGSWTTNLRLDMTSGRDYAEYFYFEAEVTDASRRPVVQEASAPVYPAEFSLTLRNQRYGAEVGQPVEYTAHTIGHDGVPVPGRQVTVEVRKYRWERNRGQWYEVVATENVTTGADGSAHVVFPDLREGWYNVEATANDDSGHVARARSWAWLYDYARPWYWYGGLEMNLDQDTYVAGDTAKLLVKSPLTTTTTALITIERENVHDEIVVPMQGAATVEIPVKPEYAPNVWVKVHYWQPEENAYNQAEGRMVTAQVNMIVPADDKRLNVEVTSDGGTYEPQDVATFTVKVTDHAGNPVDAQLSLALVDAAVLALAEDRNGDVFDAFWSSRGNTTSLFDTMQPSNWNNYPGFGEDAGRGAPGGPGAPAPTPAPSAPEEPQDKADDESQATPRREFPDTAFWAWNLTTGPDGIVDVPVRLPDSLTTWKALVRAITLDTKAGEGDAEIVVTKPVIADLAMPRFAVQGDAFALDVLGRNYVGGELEATVKLEAPGLVLLDPDQQSMTLPFNETEFARWTVVASANGENPVTTWLDTPSGGDAMELPLEVQPFAVPERFARAGSTEDSVDEFFEVPFNAVPEDSHVEVRLATGMALGVLDGLESLIGYPYGCVEQTMSRMLPNAVIGRLLRILEIEAPEITSQLPDMMAKGLQKLYGFQNPNGSWGWWHHRYSEGNTYTTAYVLHGLVLTKEAGYDVDPGVMDRGFTWLQNNVAANSDPRIEAYSLYVLTLGDLADVQLATELFDQRSELDAFALGALALTLDEVGRADLMNVVLDELEALAVQSTTTAHWPVNWNDGRYRWYNWYAMSNTEKNTAMALSALSRLRYDSPLGPKAARWLMENRWGPGWRSTQATAFAVLALTDYILASGELESVYDWTVQLDGREVASGSVNRDNITERIAPIVLTGDDLIPGDHTITMSREGDGTLFYTIVGRMARYYDGFEPTEAVGLGIKVNREYNIVAGRGGKDGWSVGDVVNVRLTLDTDEELRYVIIEDMLPAGFEPLNEALDTESKRVPDEPGQPRYWRWYGYERKEMRDERVTFFDSYLPPGTHSFDYAARVITPGVFSARPAEAYTMYRPEVWGRSASDQVTIAADRLTPRPDLVGDFDRDCRLTDFDASLVADAWESGDDRDANGDGRTDAADIATAGGRDGLECGDGVPLPPGPAGEMSLTLQAPEDVMQGQTFVVEMVVDGAGNVGAYEAELRLPAGMFEVVDLGAAERLPDARLLGPIADGNTVRLGGFAPDGNTDGGRKVLATLTLKALGSGDAAIEVQHAQIVTDRGGEYHVTADGVTVSPEPWTPRGTVYLPAVQR